MANLLEEYRKIMKNEKADDSCLVPLLIWISGYQKNIRLCQEINREFFYGNAKIYILELSYSNVLSHFIKMPKVLTNDEKINFYYDDLCAYFNFTKSELTHVLDIVDTPETREQIAKAFGYTKAQCKQLSGVR